LKIIGGAGIPSAKVAIVPSDKGVLDEEGPMGEELIDRGGQEKTQRSMDGAGILGVLGLLLHEGQKITSPAPMVEDFFHASPRRITFS
jgi:hypothetical protein